MNKFLHKVLNGNGTCASFNKHKSNLNKYVFILLNLSRFIINPSNLKLIFFRKKHVL